MIDEDRLRGLSEEQIEELLNEEGTPIDDVEHHVKILDGFESILKNGFGLIQGNEAYFVGAVSPYHFVGAEDKFWDKLKDTTRVLVEGIKKLAKEIYDYYTGDGQKQIDDADAKSNSAVEAMGKLNASIPVPEGNALLKKEKYFKPPSVEGLDEDQLSLVNGAISKMNSAVDKLDGVKTVGDLVNAYKGIRDASIESAKSITDAIKKAASDASSAADKLNSPDIPKDDEANDVKSAKKEEIQNQTKEAKEKGNGVSKIGKLRNKFLSPALVISGCLSQVEKLKDNKEFKG